MGSERSSIGGIFVRLGKWRNADLFMPETIGLASLTPNSIEELAREILSHPECHCDKDKNTGVIRTCDDCVLAYSITQALLSHGESMRREEREAILKQIEFCGFGSIEWRMKLIEKLKDGG